MPPSLAKATRKFQIYPENPYFQTPARLKIRDFAHNPQIFSNPQTKNPAYFQEKRNLG